MTVNVQIVVESMFGNTRSVAEGIASGLRDALPGGTVEVVPVAAAPARLEGASLLLVGGPTHGFSMTRESTREDAGRQGASGEVHRGLREWIDEAEPGSVPVITFDTRVRHVPGSAAKAATKALRRRGFTDVDRGESFWVSGTPGPLVAGEAERAAAWGRSLALLIPGDPRQVH